MEPEGSVDKKVADAVAPSLQRLRRHMTHHSLKFPTGLAPLFQCFEMNSKITANGTEITKLKTLIGSLPEGNPSKTIIEYIDSEVAGIDFTDEIAAAKSEAISTAASDATTKSR